MHFADKAGHDFSPNRTSEWTYISKTKKDDLDSRPCLLPTKNPWDLNGPPGGEKVPCFGQKNLLYVRLPWILRGWRFWIPVGHIKELSVQGITQGLSKTPTYPMCFCWLLYCHSLAIVLNLQRVGRHVVVHRKEETNGTWKPSSSGYMLNFGRVLHAM